MVQRVKDPPLSLKQLGHGCGPGLIPGLGSKKKNPIPFRKKIIMIDNIYFMGLCED